MELIVSGFGMTANVFTTFPSPVTGTLSYQYTVSGANRWGNIPINEASLYINANNIALDNEALHSGVLFATEENIWEIKAKFSNLGQTPEYSNVEVYYAVSGV